MGAGSDPDRALAGLPLFDGVPATVRDHLLRNAVAHGVPAGAVLFEQGDPPNFQHVVVSGSVQLFGRSAVGREVLIELVRAPDLVIPAAVVTDSPYLMRAVAPEASRILLIHAATLRAAVASDPALARQVIDSLAGQFRRMVRQVKNLKLRSAVERVGCYILVLSSRQGTPDRAVLPYEKKLIASELGITRESFSRALAILQRSGVAVRGDTIAIVDPARLAARCKPDPLIDGPDRERLVAGVAPV
ncbi:MAG: cyclic nucleotide-binding domain-containing protein [Roseiarcus sp.]